MVHLLLIRFGTELIANVRLPAPQQQTCSSLRSLSIAAKLVPFIALTKPIPLLQPMSMPQAEKLRLMALSETIPCSDPALLCKRCCLHQNWTLHASVWQRYRNNEWLYGESALSVEIHQIFLSRPILLRMLRSPVLLHFNK